MKIAVVGGTGMLGRQVVHLLRLRGHEVRVLSRNAQEYRVDLKTGEGLTSALEGCDVVIDASNASSQAEEILVQGSRRLARRRRGGWCGPSYLRLDCRLRKGAERLFPHQSGTGANSRSGAGAVDHRTRNPVS
ncbi:NmrA family NAD(P)-binding protein [Paenibacillus sp. P25]|nr:NmrA family NAD(P)-binding protein [Paenibacillus sp. P25]